MRGRRVGITYAGPSIELPWRFAIAANPAVSRPSLDLREASAAQPVVAAQPLVATWYVDDSPPGDG